MNFLFTKKGLSDDVWRLQRLLQRRRRRRHPELTTLERVIRSVRRTATTTTPPTNQSLLTIIIIKNKVYYNDAIGSRSLYPAACPSVVPVRLSFWSVVYDHSAQKRAVVLRWLVAYSSMNSLFFFVEIELKSKKMLLEFQYWEIIRSNMHVYDIRAYVQWLKAVVFVDKPQF